MFPSLNSLMPTPAQQASNAAPPVVVELFDDVWYESQSATFRRFRAMKDRAERIDYCAELEKLGIIVNRNIFVYRMTPSEFLDLVGVQADPANFPMAADMILKTKPFSQWQSNPGVGKGVGAEFPPLPNDSSLPGAKYVDGRLTYRKFLREAQYGTVPTYYADWSLDGMVPFWVCVAVEPVAE